MDNLLRLENYLGESVELLDKAKRDVVLLEQCMLAVDAISTALKKDKPVLTCGNGGSASDALHISGELVGRFHLDRQALNVICLNSNVTIMTAWGNDVSFDSIFSRQVSAHGSQDGILWGLSTSGNSKNVVDAFQAAKELGMFTIAMTGYNPGLLGEIADCTMAVPGGDAPSAQNLHVVLYHFICAEVERNLVGSRA